MSDNGLDLLVYIALTIGAGALSLLKSSREKKAKAARPEIFIPENEDESEPVVIKEQPSFEHPKDVFARVENPDDELAQKIKQVKLEGIANFGRTDEERYAMLERLQQESRSGRKKRFITSLTAEQEEIAESFPEKHSSSFEFDTRNAIISAEILNRKY